MTAGPSRGAVLLYGLLTAAALTWVFTDRGTFDLLRHPAPWLRISLWWGVPLGLAAGVVFGDLIARLTIWTVRRRRWAAALHVEFQALLGPVADSDILLLAGLSAVAEEALFRGAMQPTLGLVISSLVFGLMHVPVNKRFVAWTIQALILGFALGGLFWATGNLAAPVAAHFTINYRNLHFVRRYHPEAA